MSSPEPSEPRPPLIVLVDRANRAFQHHMAATGSRRGSLPEAKLSFNAVFGRLGYEGARASDLAARAGITRQSMGEVIREMVELGLLEMQPDPNDRRAKLVTYTDYGREQAMKGFHHIQGLERRFAEEFGEEEYETARHVLERVVGLLSAIEDEVEAEVETR
jgi:DNA-binding MarR family transcriptional regulator